MHLKEKRERLRGEIEKSKVGESRGEVVKSMWKLSNDEEDIEEGGKEKEKGRKGGRKGVGEEGGKEGKISTIVRSRS